MIWKKGSRNQDDMGERGRNQGGMGAGGKNQIGMGTGGGGVGTRMKWDLIGTCRGQYGIIREVRTKML